MAKFTIVFSDTEEGELNITGDFDPPLTTDNYDDLTMAQKAGYQFLEGILEGKMEEGD